MDPKQFRNIVADEVKGRCSAAQRAYLAQHPAAWDEALVSLDTETSERVAVHNARLTEVRERMSRLDSVPSELILAELDLMERVDKASHFLEYVRTRLAQLRDGAERPTECGGDGEKVAFLRSAIEEHRRLIERNVDPDLVDSALYDALDGKWSFGDILESS